MIGQVLEKHRANRPRKQPSRVVLQAVLWVGFFLFFCGLTTGFPGLSVPAAATSIEAVGAPTFITGDGLTRVVITLPDMPRYNIVRGDNEAVLHIDFRDGVSNPARRDGGGAGAIRQYRWLEQPDGIWRLELAGQGNLTVETIYAEPMVDLSGHRFVLELKGASAAGSSAPIAPAQAPTQSLASGITSPLSPLRAPVPEPKPQVLASAVTPLTGLALAKEPLETEQLAPEPVSPPARPLLVLDAGHGGMDPGAIAVNGMYEKDVALDVTKMLARKLVATGRYEVRLTREDDRFIPLRERVEQARDWGADFFMSVHADAHPDDDVRGASVYTLSERASDREAARLAREGNRDHAVAGVDLGQESDDVASILIDLAMRETVNDSRGVANILVDALQDKGIRILRRTHRFAGFAVLKAADVPSVLVELGYLSNHNDAELLASPEYRNRITDALVLGIDEYFANRPQVATVPE